MWLIDKIKFKRKRRAFVEARVAAYYIHVYKDSRNHIEINRNKRYSQYGHNDILENADCKLTNKSFVDGFFSTQKYAKEVGYYFTWETKQK